MCRPLPMMKALSRGLLTNGCAIAGCGGSSSAVGEQAWRSARTILIRDAYSGVAASVFRERFSVLE